MCSSSLMQSMQSQSIRIAARVAVEFDLLPHHPSLPKWKDSLLYYRQNGILPSQIKKICFINNSYRSALQMQTALARAQLQPTSQLEFINCRVSGM